MFVRLKLEDTREGLIATISQRGEDGKITGRPSIICPSACMHVRLGEGSSRVRSGGRLAQTRTRQTDRARFSPPD